LKCKFDPDKICGKCQFELIIDEEHDCISNLMAMNRSLQDEISRLKIELQEKIKPIHDVSFFPFQLRKKQIREN
jgi:hypothetical protein